MEVFEFNKTVSPNKKELSRWLITLLYLILIPIILIGLIVLAVLSLASVIYKRFTNKYLIETLAPREPRVRDLLQNDRLRIMLHEPDTSAFMEISEEWFENTYDEEETVFRAATEPEIEGIHNRLITTFFMEYGDGVFLQRITIREDTRPAEIGSELIWVDYSDLKIKAAEPVGAYFLYAHNGVIKGFNQKQDIEISVRAKLS